MMTFTPVVAGMTIDDAHVDELRQALNALRIVAGWTSVEWSDILAAGVVAPAAGASIRGDHCAALRREMNNALQAVGAVTVPYTDPTLPGTLIKAVHLTELQQRAQ